MTNTIEAQVKTINEATDILKEINNSFKKEDMITTFKYQYDDEHKLMEDVHRLIKTYDKSTFTNFLHFDSIEDCKLILYEILGYVRVQENKILLLESTLAEFKKKYKLQFE